MTVDKLKAEYNKKLEYKQRLSKSKRSKAGVSLPKNLDGQSMMS